MQRDQRTGTRCIDRLARAVQVEQIRDAVGEDRVRHACRSLAFHTHAMAVQQVVVVVRRNADKQSGIRSGERFRVISGVFDSGPYGLKEDALLGIHSLGLTRRNPEKERVECVHVFDKSAPANRRPVRIRLGSPVPALGWNFANAVVAIPQMLPELIESRTAG